MKEMIKLAAILAAFSVVACIALALVYGYTEPLIAESEAKEAKSGLSQIFPEATNFEEFFGTLESGSKSIVFNRVYVARSGADLLGLVVQVTGPTYATATMLVGVDVNRRIKAVAFLSITDVPGGPKAKDAVFRGQFSSKSIDDKFKVGKFGSDADVIAISGATITSRGVANILKLTAFVAGNCLTRYFDAPPAPPPPEPPAAKDVDAPAKDPDTPAQDAETGKGKDQGVTAPAKK